MRTTTIARCVIPSALNRMNKGGKIKSRRKYEEQSFNRIRFPIAGPIKSVAEKVYILLQGAIDDVRLENWCAFVCLFSGRQTVWLSLSGIFRRKCVKLLVCCCELLPHAMTSIYASSRCHSHFACNYRLFANTAHGLRGVQVCYCVEVNSLHRLHSRLLVDQEMFRAKTVE